MRTNATKQLNTIKPETLYFVPAGHEDEVLNRVRDAVAKCLPEDGGISAEVRIAGVSGQSLIAGPVDDELFLPGDVVISIHPAGAVADEVGVRYPSVVLRSARCGEEASPMFRQVKLLSTVWWEDATTGDVDSNVSLLDDFEQAVTGAVVAVNALPELDYAR